MYGEDIRVHVLLNDGGGDREVGDAALWAELRSRLEEIAGDPKYAGIRAVVI